MRRMQGVLLVGLVLGSIWALAAPSVARPQDKAAQIDEIVTSFHEKAQFDGSVLVAEKGHVILQKGYGLANREWNVPNTPDTKFRLGSITKPFVAILVLQLVQEGKLSLDDKITNHLTDYPSATGEGITIHHLLTHSSGIPEYLRRPEFSDERLRLSCLPEDLTDFFGKLQLDFEPGAKFQYSNSGYILLGRILEKVTGQPYEELVEERILARLEMEDTGCYKNGSVIPRLASGYTRDENGYQNASYVDVSLAYASGDLYSTVGDLLKLDQALYTEKLLNKELLDRMCRKQVSTPSGNGYGYGWDVVSQPVQFVGHLGDASGFFAVFAQMREDQYFVVLLSNLGNAKLRQMFLSIYKVLYDLSSSSN